MFLSLLGATLAFGAAVLAAAVYSEGALVALRTAAQFIGWFLAVAALSGLAGLRRARFGQLGAASVALCSAAGLLYMSYFLDWHELPQSAIRHAAAEPLPVRMVEPTPIVPPPEKVAAIPRKAVAPAKPLTEKRAANACAALSGIEALQCDRCADKSAFSLVACHEQVRLDYCASEAGDERTCPSPIPSSYPG
jgi:hypothetical protein